MLRFLLVISVMVGCKTARTEGDAKFITIAQDNPERFVNGENILIKRVHEEHWNIFYNFSKNCPVSRKTAKNYQTLRQKLEEGVRLWLAPLREISRKPIVDKFVFYKSKETYDKAENNKQVKHHISAVFLCKRGLSSAGRSERLIHMMERQNGKKSPIFGNLPYSEITLLHELGHTFDLADTYVGNLGFSPPSSGSYIGTIGNQPKSIMSSSCPDSKLCLDDKRAIQWLYRYHYEGLDPTDCPPEFVYEELTHTSDRYTNRSVGGCVYKQPLIIELRQKHFDKAKELLAHDKNLKINVRDRYGFTALHYVAPLHHDFDTRAVRILSMKLLDYPEIDVNISDKHGNTPLHWAALFGNTEMVWFILFIDIAGKKIRTETNLNAQNKYGMTALHYATRGGRNKCADYLLRRSDIEVNIKESRFGNTPLHEAAKNGHTETVKMLLAHENINRNIRNRAGKTARQLAVDRGYEETTAKAFD